MADSDVVPVRIDGHIKGEAANVPIGMRSSISDAIRMPLTCITTGKSFSFNINRVQSLSDI